MYIIRSDYSGLLRARNLTTGLMGYLFQDLLFFSYSYFLFLLLVNVVIIITFLLLSSRRSVLKGFFPIVMSGYFEEKDEECFDAISYNIETSHFSLYVSFDCVQTSVGLPVKLVMSGGRWITMTAVVVVVVDEIDLA